MFVSPAEVVPATASSNLNKTRGQTANWRYKDIGISEEYLTDSMATHRGVDLSPHDFTAADRFSGIRPRVNSRITDKA